MPASGRAARRLHSIESTTYDYLTARVPHQVVGFLSREAAIEVDIYTNLPADSLADPTTPGRAGLFVLSRPGRMVSSTTRPVRLDDRARRLTYRIQLDPGDFGYSIEVKSGDDRIRTASRRVLHVYPIGRHLDLSDLLLARSITPRVEQPRDRHDSWMIPAVDLTFAPDTSIHLYFEVYGLTRSARKMARYQVELAILNTNQEGVLGQIADAVLDLLGIEEKGADVRIRWQRTIQSPRIRVPEWFRIDLGAAEPGRYRLRVTLTDLRTEASVTSERYIRIASHDRAANAAVSDLPWN